MTDRVQGVRRLYRQRDKVARGVIENLAARSTDFETEVREIAEATRIPHLEIVRVLKELAKCGCGDFLVGRKGRASRMQWKVDPRLLRDAATGKVEELPLAEPDPDLREVEAAPVPAAGPTAGRSAKDEFLTHTYNLRSGLPVSFELPSSLTRSEADRLAKFILSLPFD